MTEEYVHCTEKIITPYGVKKGSLRKKSKILLEMEWKLTQNGVNFTHSYSILSKILLFWQSDPFFTP